MKEGSRLFVRRYVPYAHRERKHDDFIPKLIMITSAISAVLITIMIVIAVQIPKEAYSKLLFKNKKSSSAQAELANAHIYPQPEGETLIKSERMRQLLYEDYMEHCYTPTDAELSNVYIYNKTRKCYLTFDDGPSKVTPAVLQVLKQYEVKATFFVTGASASAYPDIIKQMYAEGHTIGNHSFSHVYNNIYASKESFKTEVINCRDAINKALGFEYKNLVFRFPGGYTSLNNETTKAGYREALNEVGYKYIDWSCLTGDSETTSPTSEGLMYTLYSTLNRSKTGDIVVLMHDASAKQITADTLPQVIEYLYSQGYVFDVLKNE